MKIEHLQHPTTHQLDQLMVIWLSGNLTAHDFVSADYWRQQAPLVREALQSAELIVGLTDGPEAYILGFIGLQNDYIAGIFICNDAQHQGLGTALLATAQADHHQLQLNVYVANRPAIAFYHYHGFRVIDHANDQATQQPSNQNIRCNGNVSFLN